MIVLPYFGMIYFLEIPKSKRELTDVLGYGDKHICFVESKTLALLTTNIDRKGSKKVSLIQKDIKKGLGQLKGAITDCLINKETF